MVVTSVQPIINPTVKPNFSDNLKFFPVTLWVMMDKGDKPVLKSFSLNPSPTASARFFAFPLYFL